MRKHSWRISQSPVLVFRFTPLPAGTVLARLAVFPVIVKGQREAAKLNNVLPEMTKLTNRMNEAKQSGNKFECKKGKKKIFTVSVFTTVDVSQAPVLCSSWQSLL